MCVLAAADKVSHNCKSREVTQSLPVFIVRLSGVLPVTVLTGAGDRSIITWASVCHVTMLCAVIFGITVQSILTVIYMV